MKDYNGNEMKVGDSVKFVCMERDLEEEAGIDSEMDQSIILNSVGTIVKFIGDCKVEVYIKEIKENFNYWFNNNMLEVV